MDINKEFPVGTVDRFQLDITAISQGVKSKGMFLDKSQDDIIRALTSMLVDYQSELLRIKKTHKIFIQRDDFKRLINHKVIESEGIQVLMEQLTIKELKEIINEIND